MHDCMRCTVLCQGGGSQSAVTAGALGAGPALHHSQADGHGLPIVGCSCCATRNCPNHPNCRRTTPLHSSPATATLWRQANRSRSRSSGSPLSPFGTPACCSARPPPPHPHSSRGSNNPRQRQRPAAPAALPGPQPRHHRPLPLAGSPAPGHRQARWRPPSSRPVSCVACLPRSRAAVPAWRLHAQYTGCNMNMQQANLVSHMHMHDLEAAATIYLNARRRAVARQGRSRPRSGSGPLGAAQIRIRIRRQGGGGGLGPLAAACGGRPAGL